MANSEKELVKGT